MRDDDVRMGDVLFISDAHLRTDEGCVSARLTGGDKAHTARDTAARRPRAALL
jgi:hypothetical protein